MKDFQQFLGIVKTGMFQILQSEQQPEGSARLTRIQMQEARSPESDEINLQDYEGKAILVQGHNGGGWIHSAAIIDQAGPILTMLVEKLFGEENNP
jgi:hypothetical protein